jgi:hypothetical protein
MEFALGTNPRSADVNPFAPRVEADRLTLFYTRARAATDVSLAIEMSQDLLTWQSDPSRFELVGCEDEGARQRLTVRLAAPVPSQAAAYIRLRARKL